MKKVFILFCVIMFISDSDCNITELNPNDTTQVLYFVKKYLPKNPVIVEAGAFDGNDTKKMRRMWPKGKIHAFEPVPEIYGWLKKNIRKLSNIFTYNLALSDSNGSGLFNPSIYKKNPYASGSLLRPKEHLKFVQDIQFEKPITVNMITLDDWARKNNIKYVDFLWFDMQGFELNVLMASSYILKTVQVIYTEVEFIEAYQGQYVYKDVKNFLESQGFKLVAKDFKDHEAENKDIKIGDRWYANAIFCRK